jgi:hypothetical protein
MSRSSLLLYLGDIFFILLFAIIGRQSHDMSTGVAAFAAIFNTAAPFIIGWLLVAPWLGAYQPEAWENAKSAIHSVLKAILPALLVGILVRAFFEGGFSPVVFYLVAGTFMLLLLVIWRLIYTLVLAPRLKT